MKNILLFCFLIASFGLVTAQAIEEKELSPEIKELAEMRDIMTQIWYTGLPQKNIQMLSSFLPIIEKKHTMLKTVELKGILKDKKSRWDIDVKRFGVCVDLYKIAVNKKDSPNLLNAAEKLYSQYERLIKLTKAPFPEMEKFTRVLYKLMNYYIPQNNVENIKSSVEELRILMLDVNKIGLPKRDANKEESFNKGRVELSSSVDKLAEAGKTIENRSKLDKAIEMVHSKYMALDKSLD